MPEIEEITLDKEELILQFEDLGKKVNDYIQNLKKRSSDEILNGSAKKAHNLLQRILHMEEGIKQVNAAHQSFLELLNNEKSDQDEIFNSNNIVVNDGQKISYEKKGISNNGKLKLRIPLLKALIYLGGSASEEGITEYLQKEVRKYFTKKERENIEESDGKWLIELAQESDSMEAEDLILRDDSSGNWDITQKGIDYLAKNDE
ncbi:MAG: hypothetical protein JW995_09735 [Melioribacteraceae bacterium]|nr:hypothetical protein [Melioribacteraceae bacterium]